jgi:hypothetical protein
LVTASADEILEGVFPEELVIQLLKKLRFIVELDGPCPDRTMNVYCFERIKIPDVLFVMTGR